MNRNRLALYANRTITACALISIIVLAYIAGSVLGDLRDLNERMERRNEQHLHDLCEAGNETRRVLAHVLDELAAPRDDDVPGELEERQALREAVDEYVQPQDCPNGPED